MRIASRDIYALLTDFVYDNITVVYKIGTRVYYSGVKSGTVVSRIDAQNFGRNV